METVLTHILSAAVMAVMLALCLRSRAPQEAFAGSRSYRVHPGWYVFMAAGGGFIVGLCAYASFTGPVSDRVMAAWCSVITASFFMFAALVLRAASVTIDDDQVVSRTLIGERAVRLRSVESVTVTGLSVVLKLRKDPVTGKRDRSLAFVAGFRGLGELVAAIRQRSAIASPAGLPD